VLRGVVYEPDATTPAPGVLLYAYNADATGVYRRDGTETGNGRRHGQLRGWLRTDEEGRYEIRTIYPGAYPGGGEPSHVHITLTPSTGSQAGREQWAASTLFDDDPLLTRAPSQDLGRFDPVVILVEKDGVRVGERDIRLLSEAEVRSRRGD